VQDLHRLKHETGQASLNDLVTRMIEHTEAYLHDSGLIIPLGCWQVPLP